MYKHPGITLLELVVSSAIAGIFFTLAFGTINHVSFQQTKVERAQRFYNESRILMDRISILGRNQMIDYDRYWEERSASSGCRGFLENYVNFSLGDEIQYPDGFYVDVQSFGDGDILDTLRGGKDGLGMDEETCTKAIDGVQDKLYLINSQRTQRVTITFDTTNNPENTITLQREVGIDLDGDKVIDVWSDTAAFDDDNDGFCKIEFPATEWKIIQGDATSQSFCLSAHPPMEINPDFINITNLRFRISPDRDPYLAYERDEKQLQPHVLIKLETALKNPASQGFDLAKSPTLEIQTSVTSRVYGNTRPGHNIYRHCSTPRCEED